MIYFQNAESALQELSNKELQEELWNSDGKDGKLVSSFEEAVEQLFGDSGLDLAIEKSSEEINQEALPLLIDLSQKIRAINTDRASQDLIDDPAMEEIRATSLKILEIGLQPQR